MNQNERAIDELLALAGLRRRLPGTRSLAETDIARLVAMLPLVVALIAASAWSEALVAFLQAALAILAAQAVFARLRGRRMESGGLATAASFVLLLPQDTPLLLHLLLGAMVGAVLGELVFGGRGWSFLNPAVVGLAFVLFSSPAAGTSAHALAPWAAAAGGLLLLTLGLAEWRVTLAGFASLAGVCAASGHPPAAALWDGSVIFAIAFLAADPAVVPASRAARWLFGALVALLATALAVGPGAPDERALVFALMLAGIFGPLLDSGVLALGDAIERVRRQ